MRYGVEFSFLPDGDNGKRQTMFSVLNDERKSQALFNQSNPFTLSWSHYLMLMRIENPDERRFYEIEATRQRWTFRQLKRQHGSSLYERLALSRDKDAVMRLAEEGQTIRAAQEASADDEE